MILPMKKVCLVVQDKSHDHALAKLREAGIMHLEAKKAASDKLSSAIERKTKTENAFVLIQPYKAPKKKKNDPSQQGGGRERRRDMGPRRGRRAADKLGIEELEPYSVDAVNAPERPDLTNLMIGMGEERKELEEQYAFLTRERGRIAPWGSFDPRDIKELAEKGVRVFLYELSPEMFLSLAKKPRFIRVSVSKTILRLLVLDSEIPDIPPFQLPEKSLSRIDADLAEMKKKLDGLNERIKSFADRRPVLERELAEINSTINFELARAELERIEGAEPEYCISYLSGYVPAEDMEKLKTISAENNWALVAVDPGTNDAVPTKLKNNAFSKMLSPLTGFLDLVPGYKEVDVSGWFLLFFTIFFGMIFGDAGYGSLLFIIAIISIIKTAKKGSVPIAIRLLALLSISNVAWGTLTCTWFGIDIARLPQFFRDISLSYISTAKGAEQNWVNENLQVFCFTLALAQLGVGRINGIIRNMRSKNLKLFADLGCLGMIWGMYNVVLFLVVNSDRFPLPGFAIIALGAGFALNFAFGYYEGNMGRSLLNSLKNIISVILGVTGVFSDIMSYIRLWAVGLAGAALAATFNNMAGPLLGNFLVFLGIILLVFGHGLNFILTVLSVLVHGVRLNILEFSSHVGLAWSGFAYKPFAETAKK